jgi:hypothetical protein
VALAATACLAVSGCGTHPGAAAVVGSQTISQHTVDDFAGALCSAQTAPSQSVPSRAARENAVQILLDETLSREYGAAHGIEPNQAQVSAALESSAQAVSQLPAADRGVFRSTLKDYTEAQLILVDAGRAELQRRGRSTITQQEAFTAGTRLRDEWARRHADVSVDPRFGEYVNGRVRDNSGSLSVPVSAAAVQALKSQPSTAWVSALPASQKC